MNNLGTKQLETERLILIKFKEDDLQDIYNNWLSDDKMTTFLGWKAHKNIADTKRILDIWINQYDNSYNWNIILKNTNESIGNISVINFSELEKEDNAYIYYCLGSKYWENAYATEALERIIDYLFDEVNISQVSAGFDELNINSGKVMQRVGMEKTKEIPNLGLNQETGEYTTNRIEYSIRNSSK